MARKVEAVLDLVDPMGIAGHPGEYASEARLIATLLHINQLTETSLWAVFASQFGMSDILGGKDSPTWSRILELTIQAR